VALADGVETTAPADASAAPRLRALVIGTDDWATEQIAATMARAGHTILRCHEPGEPAFPCNALIEGRRCPLDAGFDVAITARARIVDAPTVGEFGLVCALRQGIPLVVSGLDTRKLADLATRVVEPGGDVVSAAQQAVAEKRAVVDITKVVE
jgi:hypothetical protein